jgi:hypothetical protein
MGQLTRIVYAATSRGRVKAVTICQTMAPTTEVLHEADMI